MQFKIGNIFEPGDLIKHRSYNYPYPDIVISRENGHYLIYDKFYDTLEWYMENDINDYFQVVSTIFREDYDT